MIFRPEHIKMILEGKKTATRRIWKKPMVKVGGIYKVKAVMLSKVYHCRIKVNFLYHQRLGAMTLEDAKKEGYDSLEAFQDIWIAINGEYDLHLIVDVVEFELVRC